MNARGGSEKAFSRVYANKLWGDDAGLGAGPGSTPGATQTLSALLGHLVLTLNISSMLDVPCGAMAWQPEVLSVFRRLRAIDGLDGRRGATGRFRYVGVDIVPSVIADDARRHPDLTFVHADVTDESSFASRLGEDAASGPFDLVLSRAFFYHLSAPRILSALRNIKRTGSTWLLATTHGVRKNVVNATWLAGRRHGLDAAPMLRTIPTTTAIAGLFGPDKSANEFKGGTDSLDLGSLLDSVPEDTNGKKGIKRDEEGLTRLKERQSEEEELAKEKLAAVIAAEKAGKDISFAGEVTESANAGIAAANALFGR